MILLFLLGTLIALFLSAFFSGSESGLYFVRKERISILDAQGDRRASRLLKVIKDPQKMIITMLIGNTWCCSWQPSV